MVLWFLTSLVAVGGPRKKKAEPPAPAPAEARAASPMDNDGIHAFLVSVLGEEAARASRTSPGQWIFEVSEFQVQIVTDEQADRMRILVPVAEATGLPEGMAERMLQANFDSALDARYAFARGLVWATFIHPLSPLSPDQLASGLAQTVTAAATFGTTFTSGVVVFGGGDSGAIYQELLERLQSPIDKQGI